MGSGPTDPSEAHFDKGLWGFDGTQWRKLPLLWGYSGVVSEEVTEVDVGAGTVNLYSTPVPAGEVHVLTNILLRSSVQACGYHHTRASVDSTYCTIKYTDAPVTGTYYYWQGTLYLGPGDRVRTLFGTCTEGATVLMTVVGYKMDIDL